MKINWGVRVFALYIGFVLLILFMVFRSFQESVDLVTEDYYAQELDFQRVINKKAHANNLTVGLEYELKGKELSFYFPPDQKNITGSIKIYRPSNKNFDKTFVIELNLENKIELNLESSPNGLYKMMVDWTNDSIGYFVEKDIYLQP
jgi:hypothetical protein